MQVDPATIEALDSIVEQDDRFWNRTHLIQTALDAYVSDWEEGQELPPNDPAPDR